MFQLTLSYWTLIPIILSILCLFGIFSGNRYDGPDAFGLGFLLSGIVSLLWLIPLLLIWLIYFIVF